MGSRDSLNDYIRSIRKKTFAWGEHDCLVFSNAAFKVYHGFGYADDWLGEYMNGDDPLIPSKLKAKFKAESFDEAVERVLDPIDYTPPRGALVATLKAERWVVGYALGISMGSKAAFLSRAGVVYFPLDTVAKAWLPR
jgi:hypothetical protein